MIRHYTHPANHCSEADPVPGRLYSLPDCCPHPECQAVDVLIRWGTFWRWACTRAEDHPICVQRIRCKACGRTGVSAGGIVVESVDEAEFPHASLGVPEPGESYARVITPGYVIRLEVDGETYQYHGAGERLVLAAE